MIGSLVNVTHIDGNELVDIVKLKEKVSEDYSDGIMPLQLAQWFEDHVRPHKHIYVRHDVDSISFTMMTEPASEGGKGCQFTALIETALIMLQSLNKRYPCMENSITITKLQEALFWQEQRTKDRLQRGVEGHNKE